MPEEPARGSACRLLLRSVCLSNVFRCFSLFTELCFLCILSLLALSWSLDWVFSLSFFCCGCCVARQAPVMSRRLAFAFVSQGADHSVDLWSFRKPVTIRNVWVTKGLQQSPIRISRRVHKTQNNQHLPRCIRQPARGSASSSESLSRTTNRTRPAGRHTTQPPAGGTLLNPSAHELLGVHCELHILLALLANSCVITERDCRHAHGNPTRDTVDASSCVASVPASRRTSPLTPPHMPRLSIHDMVSSHNTQQFVPNPSPTSL